MHIKGKKVTLKSIEKEDLPLLQVWGNDAEIAVMVGGWHFPTNMNDTTKWFESLNLNSLNQRFAIHTEEHGIVGTTNLIDINWKDRNAFQGIMIGNKNTRGKGYAIDAIMALLKYSFEELGLNRLDTTIIANNQPSLNLYTNKCGWKKEGLQRDWYFRNNKYWDRVLLGITRKDYFDLIADNKYWQE